MALRLICLALFLSVSIGVFAQGKLKLTDTVGFNPDVKTGKLASGIPYYILKNSKPEKRLELVLVVDAGAVLEDDDQNGLAHFCEHMAFNGTQGFPKQDLVNFLEGMGVRFGADLNAYTNADETVYLLTVPLDKPQNLIKGIQVLRDWAGFVTYDNKDINEERGVIMEEWRLRRGASDRVRDKHRGAMFYGSKYAQRDVIGDTNVLLRAPEENLRRFYTKWYRPENMSIIAVGDIDPATVEMYLGKYFSSPPSAGERPSNRPTILMPDHEETLVSIASDPELQSAQVEMIFKGRADTVHTYSDYKESIAKQLAFTMINLRLAELGRKNPPPFSASGIGGFRIARQHEALYTNAVAADKNVLKSFNALITELERGRRHGFTESELARARESMLSTMEQYYNERDKSPSSQFAQELVRHILTRESVPGVVHEWEIYQELIPSITTDDVKNAFVSTMPSINRVVMISVPDGNGYIKPTEQQVRDLLAAVATKTIEPYVDQVPTKPLMSTPPVAGSITGIKTLSDIGATELTLSNGARVVYKKTDFKNDEILFTAQSWGGRSLSAPEDHFTTMVAATVVDNCGLDEFDATQLQKMLTGKNVGTSPGISMEQEVIQGSSSPKDLRTFFELVHLGFTSPRKDPEAFATWKAKTKSDLANKAQSPEASFFDSVIVTLTQNHPLTRTMSEADVDKVDLDKAFNFYKQRFAYGSDFTFYFTGNIDEDMLKKYCEVYLASLPKAPAKEMWKDAGIRSAKGTIRKTVYKGVEPKSFVFLHTSGPLVYTPQNRHAIVALGEVMEIQLREQLREEKGGVYFVSVQPNFSKIPTAEYSLSIIFGCAPERADELIAVVRKEIEEVRTKPVPDSVVAKIREIQTKERETSIKTNRFWLSVMSQFDRDGEPYSNYSLRDELIKGLTPAGILKSAQTYLNSKNQAEFVLKPESSAATEAGSTQESPKKKKGAK